jgi:hypothetical protein
MEMFDGVQQAVFDIYGYRFALRSDSKPAFDGLCQSLAFFRSSARDDNRVVELRCEDPEYGRIPDSDATAYTPRNVVYRAGDVRYIDYHGRGVGEHNLCSGGFLIRSLDTDILYESVHRFLVSQCREFLDTRGMHRVHALGLSVSGKAVLVLLPMEGGESALDHDLLQHPEVSLLSDDSPLIDRTGKTYAFPLRLGLLPSHNSESRVNPVKPADRISGSADPGLVFVGGRSLSNDCRVERASFTTGFRMMVNNCVVGLALFQGVEFILNTSPLQMISMAGMAISRLRSSLMLLRRSEVYRVWLGQNRELNAQTVLEESKRLLKKS